MRHSEVTGLVPANDNPKPAGQRDLFGLREVVVGQVAAGDHIQVLGQHADGITIIHEIIERGDGPVAVRA